MGRPKTFTAASVLDQAIVLFRQRGYHNTSMKTIADHLGLSRSSIYATFNDRNELLEQALLHYGATVRMPGLPDLHDTAAPRAALLRVFELTVGGGEQCLLINTVLELGRCTPIVATVLEAAFEDLVTRFREAIERAQATHEIADDVDAAQTARFLLGLYLGLCVLVRAGVREPGTRAVLRAPSGAVAVTGKRWRGQSRRSLACAPIVPTTSPRPIPPRSGRYVAFVTRARAGAQRQLTVPG